VQESSSGTRNKQASKSELRVSRIILPLGAFNCESLPTRLWCPRKSRRRIDNGTNAEKRTFARVADRAPGDRSNCAWKRHFAPGAYSSRRARRHIRPPAPAL
jgi:hypothetical protein